MADNQMECQPPVAKPNQPLPKLSPSDFKVYNSMADHMELLYSAASDGKRPKVRELSNPPKKIPGAGLLTLTPYIEETHIFPILAKRMPAFSKELELLSQHKQIHVGLDHFEDYLKDCSAGKRDLRLAEIKTLMDSFGKVLWDHLSDEVDQLGANNMRQYWTMVAILEWEKAASRTEYEKDNQDIVKDHAREVKCCVGDSDSDTVVRQINCACAYEAHKAEIKNTYVAHKAEMLEFKEKAQHLQSQKETLIEQPSELREKLEQATEQTLDIGLEAKKAATQKMAQHSIAASEKYPCRNSSRCLMQYRRG
ncbi:MAG: hypothetical protein LQ343_003300 [Gyalolechia ehrenbergii]|nr:MAG: hypothetical protein LQ343_003300 [Gyalolechia ehrenbergii]